MHSAFLRMQNPVSERERESKARSGVSGSLIR